MRRLSIALVLLMVAPLACAQVYKWTDAHGTTHFSETPPPTGTKYSQVNVSTDTSAPAAAASSSTSGSSSQSGDSAQNGDSSQSTTMADTPDNRAKLCGSLTSNIRALQGSAPVVMNGSNGQQQLLSADQRKQQLDSAQAQFNQFCSNQ
ncbi:DUF4124 domain-containing protein [Dyella monticola]|uniref:DUF4124 domain-containing protein n=1 Tax=Dyella monticola TaxID=1927958 RepID=A0A370X445_9GAMM|nr:DUF4124 domain-containing protein [Dyella monticola]RDS83040.1 DUF4124 domain-containing protein [Dyella monticola]